MIVGAQGRMGRLHAETLEEEGVSIVQKDPDFVVIATPDSTHGEIVVNQLAKNTPIFCEKPLCTRMNELKVIEEFENPVIGQNFPLRYHSLVVGMRRHIAIGNLGEIYRVEGQYNYGRPLTGWKREKGYSIVLGGLIHMIDAVRFVTGQEMEVEGAREHDKCVMAVCRLQNGGLVYFCADFGTGIKKHNHYLRATGTERSLIIENYQSTDKKAALKEFIKNLRGGNAGVADLESTRIALEIECRVRLSPSPSP